MKQQYFEKRDVVSENISVFPIETSIPILYNRTVVRHETIRVIFAKVTIQNLVFEGADVSNAYLSGDLDTSLVMKQPTDSPGIPEKLGLVFVLQKSIYGAKQAGKIWGSLYATAFLNENFSSHLKTNDYTSGPRMTNSST